MANFSGAAERRGMNAYQQLAVRGITTERSACCCGHDTHPVSEAERARSLCLPEGCADPTADAEEQRHRRSIAPQLEAGYT